MAKNTQIIQVHSMIIMGPHLAISKTKFLLLVLAVVVVDIHKGTTQSNYLISAQIHGRQKLQFLSAYLGEFPHSIQGFIFLVYMIMDSSADNHQFLEESVMITYPPQLQNILLINGNVLETFKIHDITIVQLQMVIKFMWSVELEHCMSLN